LTASQLFVELRYELNDQNRIRYSDYQLLSVLNATLRIINIALNNLFSPIIVTAGTVALTSGVGSLPTDFQSIVTALVDETELTPVTLKTTPTNEEYKIMGTSLYSTNSSVDIIYRKRFATLTAVSDTIPLDDDFIELIKRYMKIYLKNDMTNMDQSLLASISQDVANMVTGREFSFIECELPFQI